MQFAAAGHQKDVGTSVSSTRRANWQQFLLQALAQLAAGDIFAFLAGEWRSVDLEVHVSVGSFHLERRQADGVFDIAQRDADATCSIAGDQHDVAGLRFLRLVALEPLEDED